MTRSTLIVALLVPAAISLAAQASQQAATNRWSADPPHSAVAFRVRHLGITWVNGTFGQWTADLNYDPAKPEAATVTAHIQAATISTGNDRRDNDLRTNYLATDSFPEITFKSTRVEPSSKPMSAACSRPRAAAAPRFPLLPTSSGRITALH